MYVVAGREARPVKRLFFAVQTSSDMEAGLSGYQSINFALGALSWSDQPSLVCFPTQSGGVVDIIERAAVTHWYLGIFLLADDAGDVMESIEAQYKPDPVQITRAVFRRWLKGRGLTPVSWATLISLLKVIELNVMAKQIEENLVSDTL